MKPAGAQQRGRASGALAWSLAAALSAAAVGVVDAWTGWATLGRYAPAISARPGFVLYTGFLYALAGLLLGAPLAAIAGVLWRSRPAAAADERRAARTLAQVATLLIITPAVAYLVWRTNVRGLITRKHLELLIAASCALGLAAWALSWALSLVIARVLERPLASTRIARRLSERLAGAPPQGPLGTALAAVLAIAAAMVAAFVLARALASGPGDLASIVWRSMGIGLAAAITGTVLALVLRRPLEPVVARLSLPRSPAAGLLAATLATGAVGAAAAAATWSTAQHLPVRAAAVLLACAAATIVAAAVLDRFGSGSRRARWLALAAGVALCASGVVFFGSSPAIHKLTGRTGLAAALGTGLRWIADLDRDGHSALLGGGDCDDLDSTTHPGAADIPDDGIDQNCVGGDRSTEVGSTAPRFYPVPDSVPRPLSVVLITIDTLRADHLGSYGYHRETSPRIDAVGAAGAVFENAWAHAPSTRYSIPALLTGRYPLAVPYDYSVRGWPGLLPRGDTIATVARAAGHFTAAILNYWYFDRRRGMDRGFEVYDNSNRRLHKGVPGEGPAKTTGSSSRQQTDAAIEVLDRLEGDEPFFLWVHYYDPHYAYEKHPEVADFGDGPVARYDSEIRFTDHHVGRLLDALDERGLYQRTAIVITGDHGEGFGEHGVDLHGYHLYAAQTRVPLIMRIPGLEPSRPTTPVGHVDILPTLANFLGAEPSPRMQGRSLVGALTGAADPHADGWVFQQLSFENHNEMRAAASKRCHVIFRVSPTTSWELFRIDDDPGETRDVIADPGPCADAVPSLQRWYEQSEIPAEAADALMAHPPTGRSLGVRFGDRVELVGLQVPKSARRGQLVELTYTFRSLAPLADRHKIFVHFEGPGGSRFLGDHAPVRPFSWWKPGQYIRYTRSLKVPPSARAGSYPIWMGIFHKDQRLPVTAGELPSADSRVRVGTLQIR